MSVQSPATQKRMRYAIYARYSSEMQTDLSIEAQVARCQKAIAARDGVVVEVFKDEAVSGWSLERDGFQALQAAAARGRFDAVMFWKFDRLARNHDHAVMIKMLLRKQYDLKLHCVEGYSEDDDNSAYGAMMEQMLAVFSAFYSKNLSTETKRGKHQRAVRGEYNGSIPPLGYDLVTAREATEARPYGLYVNLRQAALVRRAFKLYASGLHSDRDIAAWFNQRPVIQALRKNRAPMNKDTVREILQNRSYTGRVGHTDTIYRGSLGERRTTKRGRAEWFEGKHKPIISDELFDRCQQMREANQRTRKVEGKMHTYILADRVLCLRCAMRKPPELADERYGHLRPTHIHSQNAGYYRCQAVARGYAACGQSHVRVDDLDAQLLEVMSTIVIPDGVYDRIEHAVAMRSGNEEHLKRIGELREVTRRMDTAWENGFIEQDEYLAKRRELQRELDSLRPVDYDELNEAADLLGNFRAYWDACAQAANPAEARKELVGHIVQGVYVYDRTLVGVVFYRDFAVILGENETAHAQIAHAAYAHIERAGLTAGSAHSQNGDDGSRYGSGCSRLYLLPKPKLGLLRLAV